MASGVRAGQQVLDIAAGTGDLSKAFAKKVGPTGKVVMTDINEAMLSIGRDRMLDAGMAVEAVVCDAEKLPFPDATFDIVSVAFGLRNMTHKDKALREMCRVLRPGGVCCAGVFQSRQAAGKGLRLVSFNVLPRIGKYVAKDEDSYSLSAESIRMHPGSNNSRL